MGIAIGQEASNRSTSKSLGSKTHVLLDGGASVAGVVTAVEVWMNSDASGVKVGSFLGTGTFQNDRDYETIGSVTSGSKQTFTGLSIDVDAGDHIGIYGTGGSIECDNNAEYGLYAYGDQFGGGIVEYGRTNGYMSLCGFFSEGIPIFQHYYQHMR